MGPKVRQARPAAEPHRGQRPPERRRRILAGGLAAAVVTGLVATQPVAAAADPAEALVVSYDFTETEGTTLHDVSGAAKDAVVVGGEAWRGGYMDFTGANHVELPSDLLTDTSAATIIVETTPRDLSGNRFLWNIGGSGADAQGQLFIQPVVPRLTITPTDWQAEQSATSQVALDEGRRQSVAATIARNDDDATSTLRMYIDGVLVAEKTDSTTHLDET